MNTDKPTEIDDAMVERALLAFMHGATGKAGFTYTERMRAALTAALTPAPNGREVES